MAIVLMNADINVKDKHWKVRYLFEYQLLKLVVDTLHVGS